MGAREHHEDREPAPECAINQEETTVLETMTTRFTRQRLTALPIQRPTRDAQGVPVTAVAEGWSVYGGEICPWWAVFPYKEYRGNPDYARGYTPWLLPIVSVDGIVNFDKWKARRAFPN